MDTKIKSRISTALPVIVAMLLPVGRAMARGT